jgi:quinohemoprotein ethanol dehydrogenase
MTTNIATLEFLARMIDRPRKLLHNYIRHNRTPTSHHGSENMGATHRASSLGAALAVLLTSIVALHAAASQSSESATKLSDNSDGQDWPGFGRTYGEQHYSPLTQVNAQNVPGMGLAWSFDLGEGNSITGPIEVNGTLYVATAYSLVRALDARTGELLWTYDPKAAEAAGRNLRLGWGSRGLAWWNNKLYIGTQDGRLIGIDAKTGKPVWSAQTFPPGTPRYISAAPRVFDGKVVIGHGGDMGAARGYVTAYDAETGRQLWRFYTVPGNPAQGFENESMKKAAKTWSGEWWKFGGNGTVWNAISYDADTDTLFIGTGNGYPYQPKIRTANQGDNLYTCSIIALDAKTGAYKWHYQFVPRDAWDFDATMDMELGEIQIDGRLRKVLVTAPKNGFFYVFDRTNGQLISAEPYVKVTWASRVDLKSGRPIENPAARYPGKSVVEVWPSINGAHTWLPMAFSAKTNLVYIPAIDFGMVVNDAGQPQSWQPPTDRSLDNTVMFRLGIGGTDSPVGKLLAWNPATQKAAWDVPQPSFVIGGILATAGGMIFQGAVDGSFNAYADTTGKRIWSFVQQTPIVAPPISFSVAGKQYVTVLSGLSATFGTFGPQLSKYHIDPRSQARRVLTFALGGTATLGASPTPAPFPDDPEFNPDQERAKAGAAIYSQRCLICHGSELIGAGHAPDLRRSAVPLSAGAFNAVVHQCALVSKGMPCFDDFTEQQLRDLRQYIRTYRREH